MRILINGGAGYIGSHMTKVLLEKGHEVVVSDSLEKGFPDVVDPKAKLSIGNLLDKTFVEKLFEENKFDGVIHFAGYISVGESMQVPGMYFENNVISVLNVLDEMKKRNVNNFIFSSTAAVYGTPVKPLIDEEHQKKPESPYGESKLMVEKILQWYHELYKLNFIALRYFNASGASFDTSIGERHNPETHIIPNAILKALRNETFTLFGDDYDTPDGTCIRDYIHVLDLADAHVLALEKLLKDGGADFYNVGTGRGYSNKEVIAMVKKVTNIDVKTEIVPRRQGDSSQLVADPKKINAVLGFSPKHSDLETIIQTAWQWHESNEKSKNS